MKSRARRYAGEKIAVSWDSRRCIHAAECVHGLPDVFDPERRPWIEPDGADPERVAAAVRACPTGALQYEAVEGIEPEVPAEENRVGVVADGPLYLSGELVLVNGKGEEIRETRAALCRCGASSIKPYCDGSHEESGFVDAGAVPAPRLALLEGAAEGGSLRIAGAANGPLLLEGPLKLVAASGETAATGRKGALCRCGASANKPFCDGSHVAIGFEAEA